MAKKANKVKEVELVQEVEQAQQVVQINEEELAKCVTVSAKIRFLASQNMTRGAIAKKLNIRYQWVRNVLITPLKKEA